jgi:hypothetical protein
MKHIKLFENWAEEIEVPEYLNPNWEPDIGEGRNIFEFATFAKRAQYLNFDESFEYGDRRVNAVSLSHYKDFWKKTKYTQISISQTDCKYKLEDCYGLPLTDYVNFKDNKIKSLKGDYKNKYELFQINKCFVENLKHCPETKVIRIQYCPILSFFNSINVDVGRWRVQSGELTCGNYCYEKTYSKFDYLNFEEMNTSDIKLNGDVFSEYENETINNEYTNYTEFNPWKLCYYDPNDVDNFEFLFISFWQNSEKFREKAEEYLGDIDLGKLHKEELW